MLAASPPERPAAPVTTWTRDLVTITWVEPQTNGGPIQSYSIFIRESNLASYTEHLENCDGTDAAIISALSCSIPVSVLITTPYNLDWGDSVYAKVAATNEKGTSSQSSSGNGAKIITYPDAPISLSEDVAVRTYYTLGL